MTTFTTEDRENASPPHIVNSGASVMPVKELTDEEIYEVWHDLYERWEEEDTLKFARAILRKAQEK